MHRLAILALIAGLLASPVRAFWQSRDSNYDVAIGGGGGGGGYQGPGDVASGADVWYSCARAYSAAYAASTGNMCDLVAVTGGAAVCTLKAATTGFVNLSGTYCPGTLTPSAACAAASGGSCKVSQMYDQSGAGINVSQATLANMPGLAFSALNGLPCTTWTGVAGARLGSSSSIASHAQPFTVSEVAKQISGDSAIAGQSGTSWTLDYNAANQVRAYAGSSATATASDNAFHAVQGVYNNTSGAVFVDGTNTSGTNGTQGLAAAQVFVGNDSFGNEMNGTICEAGIWPTTYSNSSMNANQTGSNGYNFGSYTGPGDVVSGAQFWYGLRAYSSAQATGSSTAVNLMRASDSHTCNILINTSGGLGNTTGCSTGGDNGTAVATWCNATTCSVTKAYDQTAGNACTGATTCDVSQATGANQPTITFGALGSSPTMTFNGTSQKLISANGFPADAQPYSMSSAYKFTGASQGPIISANPGNNTPQVGGGIATNDTFIYGGTVVEVSATDSVNHAGQFAFNGASSSANVDGTSSGSLNPGSSTWGAGAVQNIALGTDDGSTHFWKGNLTEVGLWLVNFSSGQQTNLCENQQAYYGSGNFGAAC